MSVYKRSGVWWYHFTFSGRHIQESTKSTRKTVATEAEKNRRLELERSFNAVEDRRRERVRSISEVADQFFEDYKAHNPRSETFADYALGHVKRLVGKTMVIDVDVETAKTYQTDRLKEKASPKSINEEVGFLLRVLGEQGDYLRAKMRRWHPETFGPEGGCAGIHARSEGRAAGRGEGPALEGDLSRAYAGPSRGDA